jgi:hypothetical protein
LLGPVVQECIDRRTVVKAHLGVKRDVISKISNAKTSGILAQVVSACLAIMNSEFNLQYVKNYS